MIYGISTHIVAGEPLTGEHLDRIADAGFDTIELFANSRQIDFNNPAVLREITGAVNRNRLYVNSVHTPFYASIEELHMGRFLDIGSQDDELRKQSVEEITNCLVLASYIDVDYFILHFPGTENPDPLMKSIDRLHTVSEQLKTKLCFENVPGKTTGVPDIVHFLEDKKIPFGVCFDIGHSHLAGRMLKDIEEYGLHFYTAHIHDNDGNGDLHQIPFEGNIPWAEAMSAFKKADYKWGFMMEVKRPGGTALEPVLEKIYRTVAKFEQMEGNADL